MDTLRLTLYFAVGILFSTILPILFAWIRPNVPKSQGWSFPSDTFIQYAKMLIASLIVGIFLVIVYLSQNGVPHPAWYSAILYGYAWDSTIHKLVNG